MERQRSFSFKPTRLMLFSFTIFSSFLFLSTFTIWLSKSTSSLHHHHHTPLHFNSSSSSDGDTVGDNFQSLTGFTQNFTVTAVRIPTLIDNRLARTQKSLSGFKSEASGHHADAATAAANATLNFTSMQDSGTSPGKRFSEEQKKVEAASLFEKTQVPVLNKAEKETVKGCDLANGYWVFDESYPLYARDSCPFIDEGFDCEGNGRLDRNYSKWRWQPRECDLPRYCSIQSFGTFFFLLHFANLVVLHLSLGTILHFSNDAIFRDKRKVNLFGVLCFFLDKGSMQQKCWK